MTNASGLYEGFEPSGPLGWCGDGGRDRVDRDQADRDRVDQVQDKRIDAGHALIRDDEGQHQENIDTPSALVS